MEIHVNIGEIRIILKSEDNFIDLKNAASDLEEYL